MLYECIRFKEYMEKVVSNDYEKAMVNILAERYGYTDDSYVAVLYIPCGMRIVAVPLPCPL